MIIPVRCFTCGKVISDKWESYQNLVKKGKKDTKLELIESFSEEQEFRPSIEAEAMDTLGIVRMCCRRHFLTTIDTLDDI
jgi:DNA-directed RNA polymerase subunit N (RpoN/RPB10)